MLYKHQEYSKSFDLTCKGIAIFESLTHDLLIKLKAK
jgi:hypothetical protein